MKCRKWGGIVYKFIIEFYLQNDTDNLSKIYFTDNRRNCLKYSVFTSIYESSAGGHILSLLLSSDCPPSPPPSDHNQGRRIT
jgi:hypothetical protein